MLYSIDFMSSFLSVIATVFPAAMLRLPRTNFYLVYSVRMRLIIFLQCSLPLEITWVLCTGKAFGAADSKDCRLPSRNKNGIYAALQYAGTVSLLWLLDLKIGLEVLSVSDLL